MCIDTSLGGVALAIADSDSGEVLDSYICPQPRAAERELARQARTLLHKVGKLDKIIVAIGPGSFTGIRIGIAFAKGLVAGVAGGQLGGLSSLQAFAETLTEEHVLFLRVTANYGIVAIAQDGGDAVLRGAELEPCLRACVEKKHRIIAGSWLELETRLQQRGMSYRSIDAEQLLADAMAAMVRVTCKTGAGEVQPLYIRQPYVSV